MGIYKQRMYWLCQITGWTLLILAELVVWWLSDGFDARMIYLGLANVILGISLTHLYRLTIRRWNWVELPFYRLVPRVLLSVLVLALVMTLVNFPFDQQLITDLQLSDLSAFMAYMLSWGKAMMTWILSYTAYHYVERTRHAEIEKILLKTSIRDTEAKVLRSQLNPHFVFNALNSIRALVYEDRDKAQRGITQLSNILRNSLLADRRKTVELREEIKTVEDYLALEKVRYEDRLQSRIALDDRTLFWQVPPMMLQTLVENAIKHGVSKAVGGGFVEVVSELGNGVLHIHIRNTGQLTPPDEESQSASGGFGLENTSHRLDLLFGPEAHFQIFQETEAIVHAELVIPAQSDSLLRKQADNRTVRQ